MNKKECIAVCDKFALDNPDIDKDRLETVKDIITDMFYLKKKGYDDDLSDAVVTVFCKNNSSLFLSICGIHVSTGGNDTVDELMQISKKVELEADSENADLTFELDLERE